MKRYKKEISQARASRFYSYQDFRDKIFLLIANPLSYFFYKSGIEANSISLASGLISIIGGILLTSNNPVVIFIGSLCFPLFYLLDYVDGIVARLNNRSSVGGQYLDLIIHQIVGISISFGIFVGALKSQGEIIIPFGILSIIASSFLLSRFSIGWFSIIMKYFEQKSRDGISPIKLKNLNSKKNLIISILVRFGALFFHEDYAIFTLPIIFLLNIFLNKIFLIDIRSVITVIGGIFLFPAIILDIIFFTNNKIDSNFNNLIDNKFRIKLPDVLYFKN